LLRAHRLQDNNDVPPWLPSVLFLTVFFTGGVLISLHPSIRNRYRTRPAETAQQIGFREVRGPTGPGAVSTTIVGLLHYKPMVGAWIGVVSWCLFLALGMVQMPLPIALLGTPAVLFIAVLAYRRPRGAVQRCDVHPNGAITLTRGDVSIALDLNNFRYVRMHNANTKYTTYPSMLALYRDTRPSRGTHLGGMLWPRVTEERVVLFFNRWWDADGYLIGPRDMAGVFYQACARAGRTPTKIPSLFGGWFGARGWEVRPDV
jgi:hypothetical protein